MIDRISFGLWLQSERDKRGWSQADLARYSGLHRQNVYKIENGGAAPAVETYIALASALELSPVVLFRKAGLMPEALSTQSNLEDWEYLLGQLPQEEEAEIRQIALMKIKRQKQAEDAARAANFKPGHKTQ
jgi:transcriptional regulator with XRE-family HTH domain